MKVLIIGGKGMLGHKLVQMLNPKFEVWTTLHRGLNEVERYGIFTPGRTIENFDVVDNALVSTKIRDLNPDVVINCVGVIKQLPESQDVVQTLMTNSIFPHRLAQIAGELGFRLITISTDCVFDGQRGKYTESDESDANDLYGRSKSLGEIEQKNCLTIRTSIIGRELATRHSLVEWFLSNTGKSVCGFTEAIYSGFPTIVFADIIIDLIRNFPDLEGLFQVSSEPISKYQLLNLINKYYASGIEIIPDAGLKIDRSLNSNRFRQITGFMPDSWDHMVERMAADPTPYEQWKV